MVNFTNYQETKDSVKDGMRVLTTIIFLLKAFIRKHFKLLFYNKKILRINFKNL